MHHPNIRKGVFKTIELEEILGIATRIEGTGYQFYSQLAERATGDSKALFESLAEQERDHSKTFRDIIANAKENESAAVINEEATDYLRAFADVSIFPKLEKGVPTDLKEALKLALEVEKDSVVFYTDILPYMPDKEVMEGIIKEEKKHFKDILAALKKIETN